MKPSTIIQPQDLKDLYGNANLVIVDASSGPDAYYSYKKKHLDGALYVSLNDQLSDIKEDAAHGGRHPLPSIEDFILVLQSLGIYEESHVVVYDHKDGSSAAARFWWMLRAIGHENVQVIDGGLQYAEIEGMLLNDDIVVAEKVMAYKVCDWVLASAKIEEVEAHSEDDNYMVIDVRTEDRYRGEREPIDLVAGHIPGSINIPFTGNLDENGRFLSPELLNDKYGELYNRVTPENTIFHCGSGVTACHSLLALDHAGMGLPRLYVGSWSEWSRNNKKIVTEVK